MRNSEPRPGQIGEYWLSKKPGRETVDDPWCQTWYDKRTRQTRRVSLGTADFREATVALAEWFALHNRPHVAEADEVLIESVLLYYWQDWSAKPHGARSLDTNRRSLDMWREYWAGKPVSAITPENQRKFRIWLGEGKIRVSSIDRYLSIGRAALNYAADQEIIVSAPKIKLLETKEEKESRRPMGRPLSIAEMAKFIDAIEQPHLMIFTIILANTLSRSGAIFDLTRKQFDLTEGRLTLNPPGRVQTTKFRPVIPVTKTLERWLSLETNPEAHFVTYRGKPINSVRSAWDDARERAGLQGAVNRYSFRHGMARLARRKGINLDDLGTYLGHKHRGANATTAIYAPDDPLYLDKAMAAIEEVMIELNKLTRVDILDPTACLKSLGHRPVGRKLAPLSSASGKLLDEMIVSGEPIAQIAMTFCVSSTAVYKRRKKITGQLRAGCVPKNRR